MTDEHIIQLCRKSYSTKNVNIEIEQYTQLQQKIKQLEEEKYKLHSYNRKLNTGL